jgi:hypothetical protein
VRLIASMVILDIADIRSMQLSFRGSITTLPVEGWFLKIIDLSMCASRHCDVFDNGVKPKMYKPKRVAKLLIKV